MEYRTLTCDCGQNHTEVIGEVIIVLNGMVINARWDACKDMINNLLPFLQRPDNTATNVTKGIEKMERIKASSVAPDVPQEEVKP